MKVTAAALCTGGKPDVVLIVAESAEPAAPAIPILGATTDATVLIVS